MAAGAGQALVKPFGFLVVQVEPWFGLPSHTPVHGAAGEPEHAAPPTDTAQIGQGWVGFPVSTVAELSSKSSVTAPLPVLRVPLAGEEKVFVTHTERPAFEIGSGVPKRQPVLLQS
jgi:hypothetical protein